MDSLTAPARAALARYGAHVVGKHRLTRLAESFNTVFRVDTADATFTLRVGPEHPVHPAGAVRAEGAWTRQLSGHGLRVPQLVPADDGAPSVMVPAEHLAAPRECSLWTWVPGEPVNRPVDVADVRQLAALSARLHVASAPLADAPPGALTARSVFWFDVPDRLAELSPPHRDVLAAARNRGQAAVDRLWTTSTTVPRIVHGDLTPDNVVMHDGELFAIDCQDLSWGHVEQDLAHTLYGITRGVELAARLTAFRAHYEQVRPWPDLDLALLTDLVAARRVSMVNLAVLRRRPDLQDYVERHADALRPYVG